MSWARDAVAALRKIILIEDRIVQLTNQVKQLAELYSDMDRRLARLEGKFELIEKMGGARSRALPEK
jgi:hypothetical protein